MLNHCRAAAGFLLFFSTPSFCVGSDATESIAVEAGWLSEVKGNPTISAVHQQAGRIARLEAGDSLATRDGDYVELGLSPKTYLRIGGKSQLRVNSTKFEDMRFEISEGTVIVDAIKFDDKKHSLKLVTPAGEIKLLKPGLVRLQVTPPEQVDVLVHEGTVEWVRRGEGPISLKSGSRYNLQLARQGFPQQTKLEKTTLDEIDRWSFERSELLRGKDESVAGAYQQGQSIAVPRKAVNVGGGATRASAETAKHATGAIRLRAIDDEKKPLQNFESRIQNIQTKQVSAGPKDKKGEVHFENTAPGQYQVFIQKKGYITAKSQVVEIGDRGVEVSLIIPKEELLQKMEEEGRVAFEAQDYPKALEKYQAALELVPWEIPMRQNVMLSLVRLNQADKAREIARQALVYEPDEFPKKEKEIMSTVSFEEGKLYLEQQKFDKAVVSFVEALQGDPGNGQIYYGLALAYGHQGKYPEALRHIDEAIKLSPGEANYVEAKNMLLSNAKVAGEK